MFEYEFNLRCPLYFMIGMFLYLHSWNGRVKWGLVVGALVVMILAMVVELDPYVSSSPFFRSLFDFVLTISMTIIVWRIIPETKWPRHITSNAFPMFIMHGMILYLLPLPFKALGVWRGVVNSLGPIPVAICTICFAVLVAVVIKRVLPRFSIVVFGGR